MNLTPHAVVSTLSSISKQIEEQTDIIKELDYRATEAKMNYKREYYKAFLVAQGAIDLKKITAENHTIDLAEASEFLAAELRAAKEKMEMLRDRLEVGRSINAIMRMEWSNGRE